MLNFAKEALYGWLQLFASGFDEKTIDGMKKLNIFEFYLNDVGHPAICASTIAEAAAKAGMAPTIHCPSNYKGKLRAHIVKSLPQNDAKELFIIHWLKAIATLTKIFRRETGESLYLLYTTGLMGAFVLFFSTLSGTKSKIVIVSHADLEDVYPDSKGPFWQAKRFISRYVFVEPFLYMLARMKNIYFASNCDTLIEKNARTFGMKNNFTLPIPHSLDVPLHPARAPRRILYIGDSTRQAKGLAYLPALVAFAQKNAPGLVFINQIGFSHPPKDMKIIRAVDELARLARTHKKNVKTLVRTSTRSEYMRAIADCDAVLMPYSRKYYQTSVSGVFSEAASAGKWCIVPSRTWMSRQKKKYCRISEFEDYSPQSMLNAIARCKNVSVNGKTVRRQVKAWRKEHSPENFIKVLLKKTGS